MGTIVRIRTCPRRPRKTLFLQWVDSGRCTLRFITTARFTPQPPSSMKTYSAISWCRQRLRAAAIASLIVLCPFLWVEPIHAQAITENPGVQDYGRPGVPRTTMFVWGNAQTGVWTIEENADFLEVVSAVSRVALSETNPERRQTHTVRLYRDGDRGGRPVFEADLEDIFARSVDFPQIRERDVMVIDTQTRRRFSWRDLNQVTGTVASLLSIFILLDRL